MEEYRVTIIAACYGRPLRTRRMINNILDQNISGFEAFVIGDCCEDFQKMIDSGEVNEFKRRAESLGIKLHCYNLDKHYGDYGGPIYNYCINLAKGKYITFIGNDDIIEKDHLEHYLSEIEDTDHDLVYYKTYLDPSSSIRDPRLEISRIGHSEIIVKRSSIGELKHDRVYATDWSLISKLIDKGISAKKALSNRFTYRVMHIPGQDLKDNID